jgi:cysteine desulfurase/selenocysteine lyase
MVPAGWDVEAIRSHFVFAPTGRIATNNAASTQVPRELLELLVAPRPGVRQRAPGERRARRSA